MVNKSLLSVLHRTVTYCPVLYYTVPICTVLHSTVQYSTGLDQYTPLVEVNQAIYAMVALQI